MLPDVRWATTVGRSTTSGTRRGEVSGWLDLLGRNCCAGRSYRGMVDAKSRADCEDAAADAEPAESAGGSVPVHRAPSR